MKSPLSKASGDIRVKSQSIQQELSRLIEHVEATARGVDDARFGPIALKATEVLRGLRTLFERLGSANPTSDTRREPARTAGAQGGARSPNASRTETESRSSTPAKSKRAVGAAATSNRKPPTGAPSPESTPTGRNRSVPTPTAGANLTTSGQSDSTPAVIKPEDPGKQAARVEQQKKAARAPKRPGGHAAPRPMPPQSGKPIWSKPHSA